MTNKEHTQWLILLFPRVRKLLEPLVAHLGLVQPFGVAAVGVKHIDGTALLLGNLLPRLFQSLRHLDGYELATLDITSRGWMDFGLMNKLKIIDNGLWWGWMSAIREFCRC